jgi:hypothetical protein
MEFPASLYTYDRDPIGAANLLDCRASTNQNNMLSGHESI